MNPPPSGVVDLWIADLDDPAWPRPELLASLAPDEAARAERFHFDEHRRRYTVARGLLRRLVGAYLGVAPTQPVFTYGDAGKPSLPGSGLSFNVSHSGSCAAFAFTAGREVGVDVECLREVSDREALARRFFAPDESRALAAIDAARAPEAFFHCWTRKEAYIKAVGGGLSIDLAGFEVSVDPDDDTPSLRAEEGAGTWTLRAFRPREGAVGCVAAAGHGWRLHTRRAAPAGRDDGYFQVRE